MLASKPASELHKIGFLVLGCLTFGYQVCSQDFTYANSDLLAAIRAPNHQDLVIDLGAASSLVNLTPGSVVDFSSAPTKRYDIGSQLLANFGSVGGLTFSVFGAASPGVDGLANNMIFLTKERFDPATQTTAPSGVTAGQAQSLKSAVNGIVGIGTTFGITEYAPNATYPPSSATALFIPTDTAIQASKNSYTSKASGLKSITTGLENTTVSGSLARSDFYEFVPNSASGSATYLGNFTLKTGGELVFYRATVPEPSAYASVVATALGIFAWSRRRSG